jgi:2-C-methyl-D-erythritol 4-phosphate cytidylyltransferase
VIFVNVGVVIPAAGNGKRMGTKESKQFLLLHQIPVLVHTLRLFETHAQVNQIVVVTRAEEVNKIKKWLIDYDLHKVVHVTTGGSQRQESVYLGLQCLTTPWVLIHDAVRPFVSHQAISRLLTAVRIYKAAVLAVPVKDTVKLVSDKGIIERTPDRRYIWAVQTPQAFSTDLLLKAHMKFHRHQPSATDDSMLVEQLGIQVKVVEGEYTNIKLTTPEDFAFAEAIEQMKGRKT